MMLLNEALRLNARMLNLMLSVTVSNALLPWRSVLAVFAELTPKSREEKEQTITQQG